MSASRGRRRVRAPTLLESLKETEEGQAVRKSLSVIQPAADNPASLVGAHGISKSQKTGKPKPILSTKENTSMKTRRSKRKPVATAASSSDVLPTKSSTPISSDSKRGEGAGLTQKSLLKYAKKLVTDGKDSSNPVSPDDVKEATEQQETNLSGLSIPSESSGYGSEVFEKHESNINQDAKLVDKITEVANDCTGPTELERVESNDLNDTPSIPQDLYDMLTSDKVPAKYWEHLAEQRRIALEEALRENELLHDQIEVLEADNTRLKEIVKDAENLAQAVKDVIGD